MLCNLTIQRHHNLQPVEMVRSKLALRCSTYRIFYFVHSIGSFPESLAIFFLFFPRRILILCVLMIKSRRLRWAGHVARMGASRDAYRALVGKPEGTRPLGRHRRRWEDNIKMDLREVGWGGHGLDQSGSG
jgi:hypothetical protein